MQNEAITSLKEKVTRIEALNTKLNQEIIDIRAHSMRSNLVFYNLPEVEKEDPFATVKDILAKKMGVDENNEIEIERAHRLGVSATTKNQDPLLRNSFAIKIKNISASPRTYLKEQR